MEFGFAVFFPICFTSRRKPIGMHMIQWNRKERKREIKSQISDFALKSKNTQIPLKFLWTSIAFDPACLFCAIVWFIRDDLESPEFQSTIGQPVRVCSFRFIAPAAQVTVCRVSGRINITQRLVCVRLPAFCAVKTHVNRPLLKSRKKKFVKFYKIYRSQTCVQFREWI